LNWVARAKICVAVAVSFSLSACSFERSVLLIS
jgi:hypothetical protein